jgi:signal transduction histidine kinase
MNHDLRDQGQCIRGIRELVIKSNQSLIANDPSSHPSFVTFPEHHIPIDSFLGVPMTLGNEIKGIIALAGKENGYDDDDLMACEMLSIALVEALSLKKREEEKEKLKEMMIHSEKMVSVGGLAAGMAHEINNPLAGILQNSQVIQNRLRNKDLEANVRVADQLGLRMEDLDRYMEIREIYSMIDAVLDSGKRAADIVTNMLSFTRKSSTGFIPEQIPDLLDKTLELAQSDYNLKKQFDFKKIRLIKDYEPDLPTVMCKASEIQQVFFNILSNGAQAMMANGSNQTPTFNLKITRDSTFVAVEIKDNGPGMETDIQKRIFEPFFTTKKIGDGTGLGLAVSYFIITENYKGTIEVHSVPDKGSTFVIRLPLS